MTTSESIEEFLKLTRSTGECDEGPEVVLRRSVLAVRYDVEVESGRAWTTLLFTGAVALRITPEPAVSAMNLCHSSLVFGGDFAGVMAAGLIVTCTSRFAAPIPSGTSKWSTPLESTCVVISTVVINSHLAQALNPLI